MTLKTNRFRLDITDRHVTVTDLEVFSIFEGDSLNWQYPLKDGKLSLADGCSLIKSLSPFIQTEAQMKVLTDLLPEHTTR